MALGQSGTWQVQVPGGALLDTRASSSQGLQEAINFAANLGLGLEVIGGSYNKSKPGPLAFEHMTISCRATIDVPPIENAHWDINGVVIDFPEPISGPAIRFDSMLHSSLNFRCAVHYRGTAPMFHVNPRTGPTPLFVDNKLFISRLRARGGADIDGIRLDGAPQRNCFEIIEIEGDRTLQSSPLARGVVMASDGRANRISVQALLGAHVYGIDADRGEGNHYAAHIEPHGPLTGGGVRAAGFGDIWTLDIADVLNPGPGIVIALGAASNIFLVSRNLENPPVIDAALSGSGNRFI